MYLRIFSGNPGSWYGNEPSLGVLLKYFDAGVKKSDLSVSVFAVDSEVEKLRSVAAFFQTNCPKKSEKLFGVCLTRDDCDQAGIGIDGDAYGDTGVNDVDQRHANLTGSQEQLSELIAKILARFWEGENRLRVFPAWQILGELAILARLPANQIAEGARENCQRVTENHADILNYQADDSSVEVTKDLRCNHLKSRVVAQRSF